MLDHIITLVSSLHTGHLLSGAVGLAFGLIWHWYRIAAVRRSLDVEDARLANEKMAADGIQYDHLKKQWERKKADLDTHMAQLDELEAEQDRLSAEARKIGRRLSELGNERAKLNLDRSKNRERSAALEKQRPSITRRVRATKYQVGEIHKRLLNIEKTAGQSDRR